MLSYLIYHCCMHHLGWNLTVGYISSNIHLTSSECVDCYVEVVDTFPIDVGMLSWMSGCSRGSSFTLLTISWHDKSAFIFSSRTKCSSSSLQVSYHAIWNIWNWSIPKGVIGFRWRYTVLVDNIYIKVLPLDNIYAWI